MTDRRAAPPPLRLAVVGHVELVTLGRVEATPRAGEIAHLQGPRDFPGGGGGVAFYQMTLGPTEVHLFTAFGSDEAGAWAAAEVARTGASVHGARRAGPHTRDVVMVTPEGERTVVVVGEPLHPRGDDPLPWGLLATCDGAYFTAQDPAALRAARAARVLVVSARRRESLVRSGVRADVVVGSASDPREASAFEDYPVRPGALVLTEGAAGGRVVTEGATARFEAPSSPPPGGGSYGAGDSFAGALTYYLAAGLGVVAACTRAGPHGAAVLRGVVPLDHQRPLDPRA